MSLRVVQFFAIVISALICGTGQADDRKTQLCDKKMRSGVTFIRTESSGRKVNVRIRFVPFEIPRQQSQRFHKFKAAFAARYGDMFGARTYQQTICRFNYGSYDYIELPSDVGAVKELLEQCPLKKLTDIALAPGPRADCAPGVVHCEARGEMSLDHPFDKVPCGRVIAL